MGLESDCFADYRIPFFAESDVVLITNYWLIYFGFYFVTIKTAFANDVVHLYK